MAAIKFLAGENFEVHDLAGQGLGFYGPGGFGSSVKIGEYQDNTYISDATGAIQGAKVDNCKYISNTTVEIAGNEVRNLRDVPNYLATLQIRFEHDTAVKVQNAEVRIFDRVDINKPAVGVTCKVAELRHSHTTTSPPGTGSLTWSDLGGVGGYVAATGKTYDPPLALADSPGPDGVGAPTGATRHDWYLMISASPDAIGSKTNFALSFQVEYL